MVGPRVASSALMTATPPGTLGAEQAKALQERCSKFRAEPDVGFTSVTALRRSRQESLVIYLTRSCLLPCGQ